MVERSYLRVKVFPSQRRPGVQRLAADCFEIKVTSPAERGLANRECLEALAAFLSCRTEQLRIVKGSRSPHKIVEWIG